MADKNKWGLHFDEGGKRYNIMTTNNAESLNNVFKGIGSRPLLELSSTPSKNATSTLLIGGRRHVISWIMVKHSVKFLLNT